MTFSSECNDRLIYSEQKKAKDINMIVQGYKEFRRGSTLSKTRGGLKNVLKPQIFFDLKTTTSL